jgi:hypothetical protein
LNIPDQGVNPGAKRVHAAAEYWASGSGLDRALARVLFTWLTRGEAHWPKASFERHPLLVDQALALRL